MQRFKENPNQSIHKEFIAYIKDSRCNNNREQTIVIDESLWKYEPIISCAEYFLLQYGKYVD